MFAVYQKIMKIEILDDNDRGGVVQNVLQLLFALFERFFRAPPLADLGLQIFIGAPYFGIQPSLLQRDRRL